MARRTARPEVIETIEPAEPPPKPSRKAKTVKSDAPSKAIVPVRKRPPGGRILETVNLRAAMAGLSAHTQRAYIRWIRQWMLEVGRVAPRDYDVEYVEVPAIIPTLGAANLKAWLGRLRVKKLGKQSLGQAKAAIVWLAQLMGDMEKLGYDVAAGLSRVKMPRAETGQRTGTWLTVDEVKQILRGARTCGATPAAAARNAAMVALLVVCGLRRDEITHLHWSDLQRQGRNRILAVHGKGSKLRQIKLTASVESTIEAWREHHPFGDEGNALIFTRVMKNGRVTNLPITDKVVWLVVKKSADTAGLGKIAPHDLRRSFARGAFEAGASFELIRQSLGHSNIATTERYVNSALELDHAATDIWADVLGGD
jgi:site-specific recombinase XerD